MQHAQWKSISILFGKFDDERPMGKIVAFNDDIKIYR
jgi:hypothetical protein